MSLPGPVNSYSNPFYIFCSSVIIPEPTGGGGDDDDDDGPGLTVLTQLEEISILDTASNLFSVQVGAVDTGGGDDDNNNNRPPPPKWEVLSLEVVSVNPPNHGLDISGYLYAGLYESTIFPNSSITYLDVARNHIVVNSWEQVPDKNDPNFFKIVDFSPSTVGVATVSFTWKAKFKVTNSQTSEVTFTESTKTFFQDVTNDWTRGRDNLKAYTS